MHRYLKFVLIWLIPHGVVAALQQPLPEFEHISELDGFSHFSVYSILQDHEGFMWFGSLNGLSRYDGYQFKVFKSHAADTTSLSDDWVLVLHEDAEGILWIGTATGGLNRFDRETGQFRYFELVDYVVANQAEDIPLIEAPAPYSLLINKSITSIHEEKNNVLWIGTWGGRILKFDKKALRFLKYDHPQTGDQLSYKSPITDIYRDRQGVLWIGTFGGGLFRHGARPAPDAGAQRSQDFFQHYTHIRNQNSLANNRVTKILEAQPGLLLVATFGGGLSILDTRTNHFTNFASHPPRKGALSGDNLVSLFQTAAGDLWIGTFGDGLNHLTAQQLLAIKTGNGVQPPNGAIAPQSIQFTHFPHSPANPGGPSDNSFLSIYEDRGGTLWFGTHRGSISKIAPSRNRFAHYGKNPLDPNSLSDNAVMAFAEDRDGNLWIGTYSGGLNRFDRHKNVFEHFMHKPGEANSLSHNSVRSLHVDDDNVLWIGTRNGGLNRLDLATDSFRHYRHDAQNPNSLAGDQIIPIFEDRRGNLWIGVFGTGLSKFEKKSGRFTHYLPDTGRANSVSGKRVYAITEDHTGVLWIGTFGDGLNAFDPATNTFTHYRFDRSDSTSLSNDRILSIVEDSKGTIWVGTFGGGLCRFERGRGTFVRYDQRDGLPSDVVLGILDDQDGNIWLSTGNGIARLEPATGLFNTYDVFDGLQSNAFNSGAAFKSAAGELFFGGVNGFNCFFPDDIKISQYQAPVVITEFKKFNKPIAGRKKRILLSPEENFFTIEFAALDYTNPGKNQFAYKMSGLNRDWIGCGTQHSVSYANLRPGSYTFSVRGTNSEGIWSEQPASLQITIRPPFWQTAWFFVSIALLTLSGGGLVVAYQVRAKVRRTLEIEKVRMLENEKVRKQVAEDFHDELGHKLTHITLFTEIVKRNIRGSKPEIQLYLDKIGETAKHLSSGISNFIWALDPEQDSLYDVAFYLKDFGDELFSKTGSHFWAPEIPERLRRIKIPMHWRRHLTLLFKESMNNILKHAACRNVTFEVRAHREAFEIILSDDGRGFDTALYTPGKGLRNMRSRAKKIDCKLRIDSKVEQGTTVRLTGVSRDHSQAGAK